MRPASTETPTVRRPRSDFAVVGEALVDVVCRHDGSITSHSGGSPANVAFGLARLGRGVRLVTELGADAHGDLVRRHLGSVGVAIDASCPVSGRTATATATLDKHGSAAYEFDLTWTLEGRSLVDAGHVHTGSVAAFRAPGADVVERILLGVSEHATVSLDPNIRPSLVGDRAAAAERTERLVALADVVKASDEDLAWLYPEREALAVAHDWLSLGTRLVVVTRGRAGSVAVTGTGVAEIDAVRTVVVDTVGAGDAYMAALLDGLDRAGLLGFGVGETWAGVRADQLRTILERASRAAAITVSRAGAQPPTREELDQEASGSVS